MSDLRIFPIVKYSTQLNQNLVVSHIGKTNLQLHGCRNRQILASIFQTNK